MTQTIVHLQRRTSYGVTFHSYTEPHLSRDNELVRLPPPRTAFQNRFISPSLMSSLAL